MELFSDAKVKILAEKHGWSIARAQGYIEGELFRGLGTVPSAYALVGIDDYGVGFRAGYFERTNARITRSAAPQQGTRHLPSDEMQRTFSDVS